VLEEVEVSWLFSDVIRYIINEGKGTQEINYFQSVTYLERILNAFQNI